VREEEKSFKNAQVEAKQQKTNDKKFLKNAKRELSEKLLKSLEESVSGSDQEEAIDRANSLLRVQ